MPDAHPTLPGSSDRSRAGISSPTTAPRSVSPISQVSPALTGPSSDDDSATRRHFLHGATATTLSVSWLGAHSRKNVRADEATAPTEVPPTDRIRVALIGAGGMGTNHLRHLARRTDVDVTMVCDVDRQRLDTALQEYATLRRDASLPNSMPRGVTDMRHVFDDTSIEAVWIATPDHWHAPAAILALAADKHVYVEKPCCHNLDEGRLLQAAVARSGKHLQVGTQSRSTSFVREAIEHLHRGEIGEVRVAKAWNSQRRGSIGHSEPSAAPPHLDFDLWLGPAPVTSYRSNLLHGVWRWWYDFGCGDIGNDGVHDIDVALWGLGVVDHPKTMACLGGKYAIDDDQQFPDTQYAVCEYAQAGSALGTKQLIFEQRIWSPYVQDGYENGAAFYGSDGMLILGHTKGWKLFGPRNELRAEGSGSSDLVAHHDNFLAGVRGAAVTMNADVTAGVRAATVVHLANLAARTRKVLEFDSSNWEITNDDTSNTRVRRAYRTGHWAVPAELS